MENRCFPFDFRRVAAGSRLHFSEYFQCFNLPPRRWNNPIHEKWNIFHLQDSDDSLLIRSSLLLLYEGLYTFTPYRKLPTVALDHKKINNGSELHIWATPKFLLNSSRCLVTAISKEITQRIF